MVTFPYILDSEVSVWNDFTQLYIFLWEGTIGQFYIKLRDFLWYICPAKDESWKVPLQNDVILFPFCS